MNPESQPHLSHLLGFSIFGLCLLVWRALQPPSKGWWIMCCIDALETSAWCTWMILSTILKTLRNSLMTSSECLVVSSRLTKCHFCCPELKILGHVVSRNGVWTDPAKTEALHDYPVPRNLREVQRFLRLAGWCHHYVLNYLMTAEPLNALKIDGAVFLQMDHWQVWQVLEFFQHKDLIVIVYGSCTPTQNMSVSQGSGV